MYQIFKEHFHSIKNKQETPYLYTVSRRTQPPRHIKQLTWSDTKTAGSIVRSYFQHLKKCHFWERLLWLLVLAVALEQLQQFSLPSEFCETQSNICNRCDMQSMPFRRLDNRKQRFSIQYSIFNRTRSGHCLPLPIDLSHQTYQTNSYNKKLFILDQVWP